jgi:hypothetical protein
LLNAGADTDAKALCPGSALRMCPCLAEAHRKLAPLLDSAKSKEEVLEERCGGAWCGLKVASFAVFRKPLMGMDSLRSTQVVHLYRKPGGWKLAEFEELASDTSAWALRQDSLSGEGGKDSAALLPVSLQAPDSGDISRMRARITLRNGDSLPLLPRGPNQRVLRRGKYWAELDIRRQEVPKVPAGKAAKSAVDDSLKPFLVSTPYLDLKDSLLLSRAAELSRNSKNPLATTRRIYEYVASSFQFGLGAVLFGNSREVLRSLKGDCSEAAVLTAALLRAAGVPSRVVLGFATLGRGVFIGHAWTEAYVGGHWLGLDAALREFPAGAGRVMLSRLPGSGDMRVVAANLMLRSLGNLDIQIKSAWSGNTQLALREQTGNAAEAHAFFEEVLKGMGE